MSDEYAYTSSYLPLFWNHIKKTSTAHSNKNTFLKNIYQSVIQLFSTHLWHTQLNTPFC